MQAVPYGEQKRAMKALSDYAFAPNAFDLPNDLVAYMQYQRRGFNGGNEDPRIHDRVLNMQKGILMHLLSVNVTRRITDIQLIGNTYSLNEMMRDLTDAIFKADVSTNVNSYRQNLQIEYTNRLIDIIKSDKYSYQTQSNEVSQQFIQRIKNKVYQRWTIVSRTTQRLPYRIG